MDKIICSWCNSTNLQRKFTEYSKYEEYVCLDCHKSSFCLSQIYFNMLPKNTEFKKEFFLLEPDFFDKTNK